MKRRRNGQHASLTAEMVPGYAAGQVLEKFKLGWRVEPVNPEVIKSAQSTGYVTRINGVPHLVFVDASLRLWAQPVAIVKGARYSEGKKGEDDAS